MTPLENVLEKIREQGLKTRKVKGEWMAQCPSHEDKTPSLGLGEGDDGKVLLNCFAGCTLDQIVGALGITTAELFPPNGKRSTGDVITAIYDYHNLEGELVFQVVRKSGKKFVQRRPDGNGGWIWNVSGVARVPYHLPELIATIKEGDAVFIVEGEKDADRLRSLNLTATTNAGGVGKWHGEHRQWFTGAGKVYILPDNDPPGLEHAHQIASALAPIAEWVKVVELPGLPPKGDVSDYLDNGGGLSGLLDLVEQTREWKPTDERKQPPKEAAKPEGRRIQLTAASSIDPLPVRWLWLDRIPIGEITLTPGLAGVGKSTFHTWLIAQLTRGTLPGVHYGTPGNVIICAREDSWERSIIPRLIAADADLDRVWRAEVITDEDQRTRLTLPADNAALESEIRRLNVALVSLDPLLSAIDKNFDSNKSREIREALEPLQTIADETRCVILGNAHFNKTSGGDPLLRITGSAAFGEVCRAALAFARDHDTGERVISQVKNNLGRMDLPNLSYRLEPVTIHTEDGPSEVARLVFTGESARGVRDILNPHLDPNKGQRDIARDIILDQLKPGPQRWEDIVAALKREVISPATGQRARDELRKAGLIDKSGGGGQPWAWYRKELTHSRVPMSKCVSEQVPSSPDEELTHEVSSTFPNDGAYLLNLLKEEEKLREALDDQEEAFEDEDFEGYDYLDDYEEEADPA